MKTIEITIQPSGETKVETKGFAGSKCKEASRFLEEALGERNHEELTAEFYAETREQENLREGQ